MEAPADLEALAERYLDLWERQLAAIADDPAAGAQFAAFAAALSAAGRGAAPEEPTRLAPKPTDDDS